MFIEFKLSLQFTLCIQSSIFFVEKTTAIAFDLFVHNKYNYSVHLFLCSLKCFIHSMESNYFLTMSLSKIIGLHRQG